MAGGTWKIIVEEGKTKAPTQSNVGKTPEQKAKAKAAREAKRAEQEQKQAMRRTTQVALAGGAIAVASFNQYLSITGQTARKNKFNAGLTYGALGVRMATQIATGNVVGAGLTAVAAGTLFANQYINFQRDIAEQNASAEYLRQRSNTSTTNGNDFYRFSLK
jgi:hypothetical protein